MDDLSQQIPSMKEHLEKRDMNLKSSEEYLGKENTAHSQCEVCEHCIEGNALNCGIYKEERKPKEVLLAQKECRFFSSTEPFVLLNQPVYGGVFGFCVGDMLGVPVDYSSREERDADPVRELRAYGTYHKPFGTWSGVTSQMLWTLRSKFRPDRMKYLLLNPGEKSGEELFNIDDTTRRVAEAMRQKSAQPLDEEALADTGNAALARVFPLAFAASVGQEHFEQILAEDAEKYASLTHPHPHSVIACILYSELAAKLSVGTERKAALEQAVSAAAQYCGKNDKYKSELAPFRRIMDGSILSARRDQIRSTGNAVDSLEAAIWAFYQSSDYEQAVLTAVNLGGNTSAIAALTGGLAGICYGYQSIPDHWIQNIREISVLEDCVSDGLSSLSRWQDNIRWKQQQSSIKLIKGDIEATLKELMGLE